MKPDETQRIRGVVGVHDFFKRVEAVFPVIKGDINGVINLLLPMLREDAATRGGLSGKP